MNQVRVPGVSILTYLLAFLLLVRFSAFETTTVNPESGLNKSTPREKSDTPLVVSATPEAAEASSAASKNNSDTEDALKASVASMPSCPRRALMSVIEQLQKNHDTSKCVQTNTIMQETLELPQINYASKECLAKVVSANEEAVKTSAILDDKDNDLYMRNPCEKATEKFVIVRLCDKIKPTLFEIANMEFFSSAPKNIRVSASRSYPTSEWIFVGEFEMQNRRDVQSFLISDDFNQAVRFLKVELLSHYGKEYYCTLSFIRVYGVPGKAAENDEANLSSVPPSSVDHAVQRRFNGSSPNDLATSANTAAIFIEFGKRLTTLEANFKHYGQVIQSIRLLRNETRYLNQENSALRRHLYGLRRDSDSQRRMINRIKLENRRMRQEMKELQEYFSTYTGRNAMMEILPNDVELESNDTGDVEPA